MATEVIKSAAITNLDANPAVRSTAGKGGAYSPVVVDGTCHITSGVTAAGASYYQLVRIPSNAIVKKIEMWLDSASTTITGDIGLYYSDSAADEVGASIGKTGPVDDDMFGTQVALAAIITPTEYTFESTTYLFADTLKEVWQAAGDGTALTSDPGGFFDIVFTLTSTAGAAADLNARVTYAMPYTG